MRDFLVASTFLFVMFAYAAALNATRYGATKRESDMSAVIFMACMVTSCAFCLAFALYQLKGGQP